MQLEELRKKVIYQNSIDTWIAACEEKDIDWNNTEEYKKFIDYMLKGSGLKMQKFPLCVNEVDSMDERGKKRANLAQLLAESKEPSAATYTIKLNDSTLELIRKYAF